MEAKGGGGKRSRTSGGGGMAVERKEIERRRRNDMKFLCVKLGSIVPTEHRSNDAMTQLGSLDDAAAYIKKLRERVDELQRRTSSGGGVSTTPSTTTTTTSGGGAGPAELLLEGEVAISEELAQDDQIQLRFQELDALEEQRLHVLQNLELYRQNMVRAYDELVKQRVFRQGKLYLVLRRPIVITHKTKGKFEPKWEGPYVIEQT